MFKVRIKMENLREVVEVVSTLVTEVKLSVSKEGLEAKAVDPSHVAMLVLKLNKGIFEEFTGEPTEPSSTRPESPTPRCRTSVLPPA
jgi:proliferating cell nuclear antigen